MYAALAPLPGGETDSPNQNTQQSVGVTAQHALQVHLIINYVYVRVCASAWCWWVVEELDPTAPTWAAAWNNTYIFH